jgi:hypothetical protein
MNKKIFLLLGLMTFLSHNVMFAGQDIGNGQDINQDKWELLENKLFGGFLYQTALPAGLGLAAGSGLVVIGIINGLLLYKFVCR